MNKININKGRNLMKTMAAVVLVGMSTAGCVDMDLSPNGKPAEGNVWSTPTLAEQTKRRLVFFIHAFTFWAFIPSQNTE